MSKITRVKRWNNWCLATHGHGMMEEIAGGYVFASDYDAVLEELDKAQELLREIRPQVDIVRGSWFDRVDTFLAGESGGKFCKEHNYDYGAHFELGCPLCAEY